MTKKLPSCIIGRKPYFRVTTQLHDCFTAVISMSTSVITAPFGQLYKSPDTLTVITSVTTSQPTRFPNLHHLPVHRFLRFVRCAALRGIHKKFHVRLSSAGSFLYVYPDCYLFFSLPFPIIASIQKDFLFVNPLFTAALPDHPAAPARLQQ